MKMNRLPRLALPALSTLLVTTSVAHAHPGHHEPAGFAHGFMHPVGGWDHILAMIAVGLWASQLAFGGNKKAIWAVPLAFVSMMTIGGVLGAGGATLPGVETGIATSVLVLGVLIAAAIRLPLPASVAAVGAFALFHGAAHGAEMPTSSNGLLYGAGFVLATILLHAAGIGAALGTQKLMKSPQVLPLRFAGAAIALSGVLLAIAR
jgi:urease accessory protein